MELVELKFIAVTNLLGGSVRPAEDPKDGFHTPTYKQIGVAMQVAEAIWHQILEGKSK